MKDRMRVLLAPLSTFALVAIALVGSPPATTGAPGFPANRVLAHALDIELGRVKAAPYEQKLSGGVMYALLQQTGILDKRLTAARGLTAPKGASEFSTDSLGTQGCHLVRTGAINNTRVNQDCSYRRQAEETIAINPTNRRNLIAGQNDSRVGFNHCGYDWSFDGGATWGDQIPPFFQFQFASGDTADACSDPTAAFDAKGNAYVGGVVFKVAFADNGVVVAKSNAPLGGRFYHTPANVPFQEYLNVPLGVVASDTDPTIFNDKELMTADAHRRSPKANNVYMTWTRFNADTGQGVGADSPIYFSQSTDGGATWSKGVEISGSNKKDCTDFSGEKDPNACDQDQGSHPIVGPDGTIYVSFFNGNTPKVGINQHLFVKCAASKDCSDQASWTPPVKIADDIDNKPIGPDPDTGCPGGRACLPPNGYRTPDETYASISIDDQGVLYHVHSDFRNGGPPCTGPASSAEPPCNQDVFYSWSTDDGASWSGPINITSGRLFGKTAQWQPWGSVSADGKSLYVAFYDRRFGECEFKGCNDITLATIKHPATSPTFSYTRLTTSPMPNLVPANNPAQAGFLGDYMWVATFRNDAPYVVWADTRGRDGTVEEDVYFAR